MDNFRDQHDLIYSVETGYRWFALGVGHDLTEVSRDEADDTLAFGAYRLFLTFDATLVQLSAGYAYDTWRRTGDQRVTSTGPGWTIEVSGMLPLSGGGE